MLVFYTGIQPLVPQCDKYLNVDGDYTGQEYLNNNTVLHISVFVHIFKAPFYNGRMNTLKFANDIVTYPTGKLHMSHTS